MGAMRGLKAQQAKRITMPRRSTFAAAQSGSATMFSKSRERKCVPRVPIMDAGAASSYLWFAAIQGIERAYRVRPAPSFAFSGSPDSQSERCQRQRVNSRVQRRPDPELCLVYRGS